MSEEGGQSPMGNGEPKAPVTEHLNIKVTDGNNEVFFKIKKTTPLKKLMDAFCERQGKQRNTVRFLFDGTRVQADDNPDSVSQPCAATVPRPGVRAVRSCLHPCLACADSLCESTLLAQTLMPR